MDRMDGWMDWELGRCSRVSDGQPQRTSERPFQFQPPAYSYIAIRTKNGSDLIFITFAMISGNVYRQEIHISTRPFRIRHFIMSFRFNRHPSIHSWVVLFFLSLSVCGLYWTVGSEAGGGGGPTDPILGGGDICPPIWIGINIHHSFILRSLENARALFTNIIHFSFACPPIPLPPNRECWRVVRSALKWWWFWLRMRMSWSLKVRRG